MARPRSGGSPSQQSLRGRAAAEAISRPFGPGPRISGCRWEQRPCDAGAVRRCYVYILTNRRNTVLYTGVTRDLRRRVYQHRNGFIDGFTRRYHVRKLVYFEVFEDPYNAIRREKQIKSGPRRRKVALIASMNPGWRDLYAEL